MCSISLCMIVKNEEKNIKRCLNSAEKLVDEIIIVDTGSIDQTKVICASFQAKIYDYEWTDNFSDARNYCISLATSDWILWLDADEQLFIEDIDAIKKLLSHKETDLYSLQLQHINKEEQDNFEEYYISYHHRLFRNNCGYRFQGSIHEYITLDDNRALEKIKIMDFVTIKHYGYREEDALEKSVRNLKLLLKEKTINSDNPWLDYHIAAELYRLKDVSRSYSFVNNAISMFVTQNLVPPPLVYKLKYEIIINYCNTDNAVTSIEKAIELYPDYVELYFYKGSMQYQQQKYEEAIKSFQKCLVLGEFNPNYLIMSGNGSYKPYYFIGLCYEKTDKILHAIEAFTQSLLINPKFNPSLEQLDLIRDRMVLS